MKTPSDTTTSRSNSDQPLLAKLRESARQLVQSSWTRTAATISHAKNFSTSLREDVGKSIEDGRTRLRGDMEQLIEDGKYWLIASPSPVNHLDVSNVERFYETGTELIEAIVGAIACGQHVALAGPRGCGKSYCIARAIELAEKRGLLPKKGYIKIQGNKELPRDYLIEDDIALKVKKGAVIPERKDAPLFRLAKRDVDGLPTVDGTGFVVVQGEDDQTMQDDQHLVLFLDEVNRFSDGVLDSLLLLLEEGEAILAGRPYKLRIVVLMTMNPPGYDASARNLSPPLSARIGRQYRLLSPQVSILTDTIAPHVIRTLGESAHLGAPRAVSDLRSTKSVSAPTLIEPDFMTLRRAAAATLCCWGHPATGKPGFEYLSPEMRSLLVKMADSDPALAAAMRTLSELCHFGPDARALIDWLKAAAVAASNEARSLWTIQAEVRGRHFVETAITTLSHKVQDSFSSSSRPDNTRRKEEAIQVIVRTLLQASPEIDRLLYRRLDDDALLGSAAAVLWGNRNIRFLRRALIDAAVADDDSVSSWCDFIIAAPERAKLADGSVDPLLVQMEKLEIAERVDGQNFAFSSEAHQRFCTWLSEQPWIGVGEPSKTKLIQSLQKISKQRAYPSSIRRYLERLRCVQDGVYPNAEALAKEISARGPQIRERTKLCGVADCIDLFWIRAEHYGEEVIPLIKARLDDVQFDEGGRSAAKEVLRSATSRMAAQPTRGRNTRKAMRALARLN